jgi:hypothetical protein
MRFLFLSTPSRTTKYTYGAGNRISSESVWSGDGTSGNPLSQTTYTYDEYSANYCKNGVPMLSTFTGAQGHDDVNFGVNYTTRLNLTSVSRWVSGTTWLTSHMCYDTLGNVTQEVDKAGDPTSYDDTDNWTLLAFPRVPSRIPFRAQLPMNWESVAKPASTRARV